MFAYDAQLLEVVTRVPQSIPDVLGALGSIDALCVEGDGLKWFNTLYLRITEAVEATAPSSWLAQLDVQFASLYLRAFKAYLLGGVGVPECWQVLFAARSEARITRLQFALAGVNAHINRDLCEAIVATCRATETIPAHGGVNYNDYTALNATLDAQIDWAKATLRVGLLGGAVPEVSHLEDVMAAWDVAAAREAAWHNSQILWSVGALSEAFLDPVDGFATVIGKGLLTPIL